MDGPAKTMTPGSSLELSLKKMLYHHRTSVSAAISSMLATMAAFPLDSIKSRLQVNRYDSVMDCVKKTYVEEGPKGFYRGIAIPMLTITIVRTLSFTIYNDTKQFLHQRQLVSSFSARDIALSGLAGGMSSGFLNFCWILRIRIGQNPVTIRVRYRCQAKSTLEEYQHLAGRERNHQFTWASVKGLYYGFNLHCLRDTLGTGLYFLGYDTARFFAEKKIDEIEYRRSLEPTSDYGFVLPRSALPFLCGSTCGVTSWIFSSWSWSGFPLVEEDGSWPHRGGKLPEEETSLHISSLPSWAGPYRLGEDYALASGWHGLYQLGEEGPYLCEQGISSASWYMPSDLGEEDPFSPIRVYPPRLRSHHQPT
ncbi:hypothetical protein PGT21_033165 [Puccinia graminis f. sp. tritici]|uniref:Uncharacterized protein n=1 Tax=Puccinia graminis f. sp. tritici TaxID=56615 RepID=A0A5B0M8R8_PUCGR|nr:hypothetical protein PGT21_033165 [Puccinia graminis f. sp. tritici]